MKGRAEGPHVEKGGAKVQTLCFKNVRRLHARTWSGEKKKKGSERAAVKMDLRPRSRTGVGGRRDRGKKEARGTRRYFADRIRAEGGKEKSHHPKDGKKRGASLTQLREKAVSPLQNH